MLHLFSRDLINLCFFRLEVNTEEKSFRKRTQPQGRIHIAKRWLLFLDLSFFKTEIFPLISSHMVVQYLPSQLGLPNTQKIKTHSAVFRVTLVQCSIMLNYPNQTMFTNSNIVSFRFLGSQNFESVYLA